MKALVTGASGFIGSHLVDGLIREGHEVTALVRKTSRLHWLENKPVELVTGDVLHRDSLTDAVKNQDVIFHVAGMIVARSTRAFMRTNHAGTENLMETIVKHNPGVKKVVYVSSMAAGGPTTPDRPMTEEDPSHPISAYGKSKYLGEETTLSYKNEFHVTAIRPPVVYGPRDRGVLKFVRLVAKKIKINPGSRDRYVTLIHVSDLIEALILTATKETKNGEMYYVDDGTPVRTWLELQDLVADALNKKAFNIRIPLALAFLTATVMEVQQRVSGKRAWINLDKYREFSQRAWLCDGTKIREQLGFTPNTTLSEGLRETISWYRKMGWIE